MLHLIPRPLHRLAYRLAHALRIRWWRLASPRLTGCRMLVLDTAERILLVRHSYGPPCWTLPSGAVSRGEEPMAAAARELREETACGLLAPREIAVLEEPLHGAVNTVHLIAGETTDTPHADGREIVDARFFAVAALPADLASAVRAGLPEWLTAAKAGRPAQNPPPFAHPPSLTG